MLIIILIITSPISAQQVEYLNSIGKFKTASSFYISASGTIYVTDSGNDELISLDTLGNILKSTGGYGWTENAFDDPVDVFATTLNVYVADKNNHRVQRFDRNLNFISSLSARDKDNSAEIFGYPLGCAVSNQGDLYILDSENQRVIKFDLFGNFIQNFGGFDAGIYQLNNPKAFAVSPNNLVYVLDESGIIIFDSFGNGIGKIESADKITSIRIIFDILTINSSDGVYFQNLRSADNILSEIDISDFKNLTILSSLVYNNKLYILSQKEILVLSLLP
ncbi:MAG TPA: NHL repeat-containing protein [Ignavibacteriaceae bacterium]|nr:NHL repeat-containing protein [Ignavibacteriaceae bacterium]